MAKLHQALTRNLGAKLLAIGIGVALWASFAAESVGQEAFTAVVRYLRTPSGLELNPDEAEHVTVILRGGRTQLGELRRDGLVLEVDCAEVYRSGLHTVTVSAEGLHLPPSVEFVKAIPSQLRFSLEQQGRRRVSVAPQFVGAYADGYTLEEFTVQPEALTIIGPADRVALVEAVSTDPIDLSEVVGRRSFQVAAYLADPYVRFASDPTVTVDVHMRRR